MATVRQQLVASLTRRYPFYSGCATFANTSFVHHLAGRASGRTRSRVPGGEVFASLTDYVGRAAFYTGDLDRKITWICSQIVKPGDTVLDIGANIGIVTLCLSNLVGPSGTVCAFEPNPDLQKVLEETFTYNRISNVRLYKCALGSETTELELRIPRNNTGAATLVNDRSLSDCDVWQVPVRRLTDVIAEQGFSSIRLIKIDVEGFEAQVFEGGRDVLSRIRPQAILLEVNDRVVRNEPAVTILREHGYGFFSVPRCLLSMRLTRFDADSVEQLPGFDLLAVPKGDAYEEIARLVKAPA
jgi:FkbM family methyltransferase